MRVAPVLCWFPAVRCDSLCGRMHQPLQGVQTGECFDWHERNDAVLAQRHWHLKATTGRGQRSPGNRRTESGSCWCFGNIFLLGEWLAKSVYPLRQ